MLTWYEKQDGSLRRPHSVEVLIYFIFPIYFYSGSRLCQTEYENHFIPIIQSFILTSIAQKWDWLLSYTINIFSWND